MKKVIVGLMLLFPLSIFAQEEIVRCNESNDCSVTIVKPVEIAFFERANLASIVGNTRIAELCDTKANFYTGVYLPLISFKYMSYELINFNFGMAAYNKNIEEGFPYFSTGFRIDGLLGILGVSKWAKNKITVAKLPPIELGPFVSYNFRSEYWIFGGFISTKIGGI
jgi:hypothetical protein